MLLEAICGTVQRAEAGISPRRARYFSLLRQRKVPKRKATLSLRPLRCAPGQTCAGALAGCAVELTALLRSSVQTATASQFTQHARSDAHATPQTPRRRRSHKGFEVHSGHRCARPRGAPALRAAQCQAERSDGPCGCSIPGFPSGRAEKRSAGGGHACRRTRMLCDLACRGCLNGAPQARSEFHGTPSAGASQVAPTRSVGDTDSRVALSLVTFFRRSERKLLRRRAHIPAYGFRKGSAITIKKIAASAIPTSYRPQKYIERGEK